MFVYFFLLPVWRFSRFRNAGPFHLRTSADSGVSRGLVILIEVCVLALLALFLDAAIQFS